MVGSKAAEKREISLLNTGEQPNGLAASFCCSNADSEGCGQNVEVAKASPRTITLNLITGGLGLGIFSLPWSTAGASLIPALVTIVLIVALNGFTVSILIEAAEKYQEFDLGGLLSHMPKRISRISQIAVNVAVWVVLFIGQVGFVDVMSNAMMEVTIGSSLHNRPLTVVASSLLALPLCFFDQRYLNFTSAVVVVVNVYIFIVMAMQPKHSVGVCVLGIGQGSVAMVSVMMQAVVIQMCVLPMYQELEDRSPKKFGKVVAHGFSGLVLIFAAFATLGYLTFGPNVEGNILTSLPQTVWGRIGRISAGVCVWGVYPIFLQSMVAPAWNMKDSPHRRLVAVAATIVTVILVGVAALFMENVSDVNVYSGAICSVAFVSGVPGIVGLFLLDKRSMIWRAAMLLLLLFGLVTGIFGLMYTDNYVSNVTDNCKWTLA